MSNLIYKLKSHIQFEEGMDDSMLSFYLTAAEKYVFNATSKKSEYLILLVAGIMFDYRIAEDEMSKALDAITPFIVMEVYNDVEPSNE